MPPLSISTNRENLEILLFHKVFRNTTSLSTAINIEMNNFLRGGLVSDIPINNNIKTNAVNMKFSDYLGSMYVISQKIITFNNLTKTQITNIETFKKTNGYLDNFNIFSYVNNNANINSNEKNHIQKLQLNLDNDFFQIVDTTGNGALVINMDLFINNFSILTEIEININTFITGKHGGRSGSSIFSTENSLIYKGDNGGPGENGGNGQTAINIISTRTSNRNVLLKINSNNKVSGGFGARGGNGGNGGRKTLNWIYITTQDNTNQFVTGSTSGGTLLSPTSYGEVVDNQGGYISTYITATRVAGYYLIRSGPYINYGIYFSGPVAGIGRFLVYNILTTNPGEVSNNNQNAQSKNGINAKNGGFATVASLGNNAGNPLPQTNPVNGNVIQYGDYYPASTGYSEHTMYYDYWSGSGGIAGRSGTNGSAYTSNPTYVNLVYQ